MTYKKTAYGRCACNQIRRHHQSTAVVDKREAEYENRACHFGDAPSLAAVYGISQSWRQIDDTCTGFERGTVFDELNKPFLGDKCKNGGCK